MAWLRGGFVELVLDAYELRYSRFLIQTLWDLRQHEFLLFFLLVFFLFYKTKCSKLALAVQPVPLLAGQLDLDGLVPSPAVDQTVDPQAPLLHGALDLGELLNLLHLLDDVELDEAAVAVLLVDGLEGGCADGSEFLDFAIFFFLC